MLKNPSLTLFYLTLSLKYFKLKSVYNYGLQYPTIMLKKYLSSLFKTYQKGDATEPSYYKHLDDFISEFSRIL